MENHDFMGKLVRNSRWCYIFSRDGILLNQKCILHRHFTSDIVTKWKMFCVHNFKLTV